MSNLIFAEHASGRLRKGSLELVSAARGLGGSITALVTGEGAAAAAEQLTQLVDRVLIADSVNSGNQEAAVSALAAAAGHAGASRVLLSNNRFGQAVAPRLAVRLDAAYLEDLGSIKAEGSDLRGTRLSYLSRVTETVESSAERTVISIKPNTWDAAEAAGTAGASEAFQPELKPTDGRVNASSKEAAGGGRVSLTEAATVIAGGRGLGSAEAFTNLVEPLAAQLNAGIGATRAVVDAGWRPFAEQVGQTGQTVSPGLYIALGISGAVQHLSGMNRSRVIVTVNRDADAPLFRISDYGIVGDAAEIAPELLAALHEADGS